MPDERDMPDMPDVEKRPPETAAREARHARPRTWPVFLAFSAVLAGNLIGSFALVMAVAAVRNGGLPLPGDPESSLGSVVFEPVVIIGSVTTSVLLLLGASIVGGVLSPIRWTERLRLRATRAPVSAYPVAILGLIVGGQSLEYISIWLGLRDGTSALDLLAEVVASMPPNAFVVLLLVGSLGAGLAEELFFRGFVQTRLVERWGAVTGIVLSSMAFGVLHFDPLHSSIAFGMGLYLGWLAELRKSVVLPAVAHVGNNFVAFLATRWSEGEMVASVGLFAVTVSLTAISVSYLSRRAAADAPPLGTGGGIAQS